MANSEKIKIPVFENQKFYKARLKLDEVRKYEIDFTAWVEDHAAISTATWTVKHGQVGVASENLATNVADALLTFSQTGRSLIEVKAVTATETKTVWLNLWVDDPARLFINDYGIGCR